MRRPRGRRGIATIEFVMSLPILVWLMMMIFLVARRHMDQAHMTQNVRHEAWLKRSDTEKPQRATNMFAFIGNEFSGKSEYEEGKLLKIYKWMGGQRLSKSKAIVLGGTWDQKQMTQMNGTSPHLSVLPKMAEGGAENVAGMSGLLRGIASLLHL
jgi:hypothetical protein